MWFGVTIIKLHSMLVTAALIKERNCIGAESPPAHAEVVEAGRDLEQFKQH